MGLFTPTMTIDLGITLENCIMMGNASGGPKSVMRNYSIDAANKGHAVVVFRRAAGFSLCPGDLARSDMFSMSTKYGDAAQKLDMFAGLSDEEKARKIIEICRIYAPIDAMRLPMYEGYIRLMVSLLRLKGVNIKLDQLGDYDIDDIRDINNNPRYVPNPTIKNRNNNLLNAITKEYMNLQGIFSALSFGQIAPMLSGTDSLEKVLDDYPVVEITLDVDNNPDESVILMDAIIDRLCSLNLGRMTKKQVYVVADQLPIDIMKKSTMNRLLTLKSYCHMLYAVTDISTLVEGDSDWHANCDTYMAFHQNSPKNMEYCSNMFGTKKRMQIDLFSSGRLGFNLRWVEEPIYRTNVFSGLPDNVCIYMTKKTGQHCRLTVC